MKKFLFLFTYLLFRFNLIKTQFPTWSDASPSSNITDTTTYTSNNENSNNSTSPKNSSDISYLSSDTYYSVPTCGAESPVILEDCFKSSTSANSCCFFSIAGNTGCAFYGSQFTGLIGKYGISLTCNSHFLRWGYIWILFYIIYYCNY